MMVNNDGYQVILIIIIMVINHNNVQLLGCERLAILLIFWLVVTHNQMLTHAHVDSSMTTRCTPKRLCVCAGKYQLVGGSWHHEHHEHHSAEEVAPFQ